MTRASTLKARQLRRASTPCERVLWKLLRQNQIEGFKFRRQHPIGRYVADFVCVQAMLVVELDGHSHDEQQEYDAIRDQFMRDNGWNVLRFSNRDLMANPEAAWLGIESHLTLPILE